MAVLRSSLWPGLIAAARENLSHQRARFKLFEIGQQFEAAGAGVRETAIVAGLAVGTGAPEHWDGTSAGRRLLRRQRRSRSAAAAHRTLGRVSLHGCDAPGAEPRQNGKYRFDGATIGWLGALHPSLQKRLDRPQQASGGAIAFALEIAPAFAARVPALRGYSKFPSIRRDLAVVVDEQTPVDTIKNVAREAAGHWLQHVVVFDVYRGGGVDSSRKSIGLGLILQDVSRTLTDADADQTMQTVMARLERELGAKIRTN